MLEGWAAEVRDRGGRAVACEVSGDMQRGLSVARRDAGPPPEEAGNLESAGDWPVYDTRAAALSDVARETTGQKLRRLAPAALTAAIVLGVLVAGAWLLTGRRQEEASYARMDQIWRDYVELRKQYPDPNEWRAETPALLDRLDAETDDLVHRWNDRWPTRGPMLVTGRRMRAVLRSPRSPDPRERLVQAGLDYVEADLDGDEEAAALAEVEYLRDGPVPRVQRPGDPDPTPEELSPKGAARAGDADFDADPDPAADFDRPADAGPPPEPVTGASSEN